MDTRDLIRQRLYQQQISQQKFQNPVEVVACMGAVQAQDYPAAKWAVGQRTNGATDAAFEQAFAKGKILRTHLLRPTWHFITPADIRWLLALTAPRIYATTASRRRQLELDDSVFKQSDAVLVKALEGGKQLTRLELVAALKQAGIPVNNERITHLMIHAELAGIVCSGGQRGKHFTYMLLEERVPPGKILERDEAVAELTRRYFTSHGPATIKDYVWWSGLTVADAKAGIEMVKPHLIQETIDDTAYWLAESVPAAKETPPTAYLLPNFDEYIVGYIDRSALFDTAHHGKLDSRGNVLFNHTILINGRVVGIWKRTFKKDTAVIVPTFFETLTAAENHAFAAVERYSKFLDMPVVLA